MVIYIYIELELQGFSSCWGTDWCGTLDADVSLHGLWDWVCSAAHYCSLAKDDCFPCSVNKVVCRSTLIHSVKCTWVSSCLLLKLSELTG